MKIIDVVCVRSYGTGSKYLLIPNKLAKKLGLEDGEQFVCYLDAKGIHYLREPIPIQAKDNVELEVPA